MKHTLPDLWVELHLLDDEPAPWESRALCAQVDPEIFYERSRFREAKRTCGKCEVRAECESAGIENVELYGIWGGLTRSARRKVWQERGIEIPDESAAS